MDGDDGFEGAAELAGYFLAQAVCRIELGDVLAPLVGHERFVTDEGERALALLRFDAPEQHEAIRNAQQWIEENQTTSLAPSSSTTDSSPGPGSAATR